MADAIVADGLRKTFGRQVALDGLDLAVRQGEIFGFAGPNGAGKTTTIRLLLDLLRPTGGTLRVLGQDPRRQGVELRRRIGYLPGELVMDGRQTAREALAFLAHLRGGVPRVRIELLARRLDLELDRRIGDLSKGNKQKVGLLQAFMHEPELLILDEPTSGLDPLVQQTFLELVREARDGGATALVSSHVLSEVQHTADRVGFIRAGRMVAVERIEDLRERAVRRIEARFAAPIPTGHFDGVAGLSDVRVDGAQLRCRLTGPADAFVKAAARLETVGLLAEEPDLEELFLGLYREEVRRAA